ncbi:MAG: DUF1257 domain-containing protein [Thermodesulfobacteriota bacterium]|nr:DUF1257 domain-containing protein [Thermodesulfobacteriota bacterium]
MSALILIVPVIIGGWPVFGALAAAAAAGLGFRMMKDVPTKKIQADGENQIEIADEKSQVIADSLKPDEEMVFSDGEAAVTFKKDAREKFTICVTGKNKSKQELNKIGRAFINKIKQKYAYQKVMAEMTRQGYNVVQEEKEGRKIRLLLRKM